MRREICFVGSFETFKWSTYEHYPHFPWTPYKLNTLRCEKTNVSGSYRGKGHKIFQNVSGNVYGSFIFAKGPLYFISSDLIKSFISNRMIYEEAQHVVQRQQSGIFDDVFVGFGMSLLRIEKYILINSFSYENIYSRKCINSKKSIVHRPCNMTFDDVFNDNYKHPSKIKCTDNRFHSCANMSSNICFLV